jgi:hypothetical protein
VVARAYVHTAGENIGARIVVAQAYVHTAGENIGARIVVAMQSEFTKRTVKQVAANLA